MSARAWADLLKRALFRRGLATVAGAGPPTADVTARHASTEHVAEHQAAGMIAQPAMTELVAEWEGQ